MPFYLLSGQLLRLVRFVSLVAILLPSIFSPPCLLSKPFVLPAPFLLLPFLRPHKSPSFLLSSALFFIVPELLLLLFDFLQVLLTAPLLSTSLLVLHLLDLLHFIHSILLAL